MEDFICNKIRPYPEFLTDFYYSLTALKKSPNTKQSYIEHVIEFLNFFAEIKNKDVYLICVDDLKDITTSTIDRFIIKRRTLYGKEVKDQTMCVILSSLGSFFKFLYTHDLIDKDPFNGKIEKPHYEDDNPVVFMEMNEIETVMENIKSGKIGGKYNRGTKDWIERDMLLFLIPIYTGIRVSALSNINIEDMDLEHNCFIGTDKRNKTKTYYFDDKVKDLIEKYLVVRERKLEGIQPTDAFFISNKRGRMSPKSIRTLVHRYTFNIEKNITPHKLRSTCATTLYDKTCDIYLVADVLGHSSTNVTKRYTAISDNRRAHAAQVIGGLF